MRGAPAGYSDLDLWSVGFCFIFHGQNNRGVRSKMQSYGRPLSLCALSGCPLLFSGCAELGKQLLRLVRLSRATPLLVTA